jgi:hypothetical protein
MLALAGIYDWWLDLQRNQMILQDGFYPLQSKLKMQQKLYD